MSLYIRQHIKYFLVSLAMAFVVMGLNILLSLAMGNFSNYAVSGQIKEVIIWACVTVVGVVASNFFQYLEIRYRKKFSKKCVLSLKRDILNYLFFSPLYALKEQDSTRFITIFQVNTEMLKKNYFEGVLILTSLSIKIIGSSIALFLVSYKLLIVFLLISSFSLVITPFFKKKLSIKKKEHTESSNQFMEEMTDRISGLNDIILVGQQRKFLSALYQSDEHYESAKMNDSLWDNIISYVSQTVGMVSQIICMIIAAYFVAKGEILIGTMISATQLLNFIVPPINNFNQRLALLKSVDTVKDEMIPFLQKDSKNEKLSYQNGDIVYHNFGISIDGKVINRDFNYTFERGRKYVVIGESGVGKSLLLKSLIQKYSEYTGDITIDGFDVRLMKKDDFYQHIAYMSQDNHLFDMSVEDNIRLFQDVSVLKPLDAIMKALNISNLLNARSDKSSLLEYSARGKGEDYSEKTLKEMTSDGEKQRICLARSFVRDADIYIFDEPTSNLDPQTTEIVQDMMLGLENKTVIVISHNHDEKFLKRFDGIVRLDKHSQAVL